MTATPCAKRGQFWVSYVRFWVGGTLESVCRGLRLKDPCTNMTPLLQQPRRIWDNYEWRQLGPV